MKQFTPLFLRSIMMMKYENSLNEDDQAKTHFSSNFIDIIWGSLLPVMEQKKYYYLSLLGSVDDFMLCYNNVCCFVTKHFYVFFFSNKTL